MLCLGVKNGHFLFNNSLYEQVDGVAMGSPLGPLFANIFLAFHERSWLTNCPLEFKPLFFRRYIDDCFAFQRALISTKRKRVSKDIAWPYIPS